ncbi:hypothetical protein C7389_12467 [Azoarcus indigens]|uniref:Uncharacterized protein n=1 Tax=Azoarcus indigens TaxID=29545 RepID=A0A4R6DPP9_9RHOO|nr:hypothetical protein C7389_12467 [Azoarcus indigens]
MDVRIQDQNQRQQSHYRDDLDELAYDESSHTSPGSFRQHPQPQRKHPSWQGTRHTACGSGNRPAQPEKKGRDGRCQEGRTQLKEYRFQHRNFTGISRHGVAAEKSRAY